jgi:predicted transcriptional regulator of viral defense system
MVPGGDDAVEDGIYKKIYNIFKQNNGYAYTHDITSVGIHNIYLSNLLQEGKIERIKWGLYRWAGIESGANSTLVDVALSIPNGVICLQYALAYHNLTTSKPWEISVALSKKSRVRKLPEYPPIKIYYFAPQIFNVGIEKIPINAHEVKIYNREKTICDCMRYRKQIGQDIIKEMMVSYLKGHNRNLDLLLKYAKICSVTKEIQTYLEVLS